MTFRAPSQELEDVRAKLTTESDMLRIVPKYQPTRRLVEDQPDTFVPLPFVDELPIG